MVVPPVMILFGGMESVCERACGEMFGVDAAKIDSASALEPQTEVLTHKLESIQPRTHEADTFSTVQRLVYQRSRVYHWYGSVSSAEVGGCGRHAERPHGGRRASHLQRSPVSAVSRPLRTV